MKKTLFLFFLFSGVCFLCAEDLKDLLKISLSKTRGRTVFIRMEENTEVYLKIENNSSAVIKNARALLAVRDIPLREPVKVPDLAIGTEIDIALPFDASLRSGKYEASVLVAGELNGKNVESKLNLPLVIIPRPIPNTMPIIMWGRCPDAILPKEIGFTQVQRAFGFRQGLDKDYSDYVAEIRKMLDEYLAAGLGVSGHLKCIFYTGDKDAKKKYTRINKDGIPHSSRAGICASSPELQEYMSRVSTLIAKNFGDHPGLKSCLLNSEETDHSYICFHKWDQKAYDRFPEEVMNSLENGLISERHIDPGSIKNFRPNRILSDDNPQIEFMRWWWCEGSGWNPMNSIINNSMKSTGMHKDFWTFQDPAVRTPSVWGSGGNVDYLNHWTYTYPDPIKIGQCADELFAMTEGHPEQQVMKMTQIIWYRSKTAPNLPKDDSKKGQWEKDYPDARFITIAPDHLREALWCKLSRPIKGIMYHGWESLVTPEHVFRPSSYKCTNSETRKVLKEEISNVVKPLGSMLMQLPDWLTDVGLLESFTSQMLYRRGSYGWGISWEADMHLILQWAALQPRIIYEESVLKNGLDKFKILVMPNCDALPENVYKKILDFQKRGGIVIADSNLTPAIVPDIEFKPIYRTDNPKIDKENLQKLAASLRTQLTDVYRRMFDSDNMDVVPRLRQYNNAYYLFAVNDYRTYGDYVGQHRLVMEKGLPSKAVLSVRSENPAVYDLTVHRKVDISQDGKFAKWTAELAPGGGNVWLILDKPIVKLSIELPELVLAGDSAHMTLKVLCEDDVPVGAIVPLKVQVSDPEGKKAEKSGFYGAKDGVLEISLDIARNDLKGEWLVILYDLASGLEVKKKFTVK
ncbi:MAG: hypothetical protein UT30_C0027G0010 [Candidatus Uhrbacteria bacterium GW2011_GWF2_39_13]|uniref:Glycoside hydrolase family 42 N-terminal domain-containing protein n=1 Tax=Candidatus Uhrbacteria bacterium GW2011_GWF2_39_13 TaxID=1618995 RepID=A0A0G0MSW8_9BACT|nr:MAG: hypothetical protein UT30_C0027G0010 [Candidatus Uhrbacteria bacterium GW2011_GWF2_39_13]